MLPPGHVPPRNNGIIYPGPVESWVTPWKLRRKKHFTVFVMVMFFVMLRPVPQNADEKVMENSKGVSMFTPIASVAKPDI